MLQYTKKQVFSAKRGPDTVTVFLSEIKADTLTVFLSKLKKYF